MEVATRDVGWATRCTESLTEIYRSLPVASSISPLCTTLSTIFTHIIFFVLPHDRSSTITVHTKMEVIKGLFGKAQTTAETVVTSVQKKDDGYSRDISTCPGEAAALCGTSVYDLGADE